MENYTKDSVMEVEDNGLPFGDCCPPDVKRMNVKTGTKLKNIIEYSIGHYIDSQTERQIVISGSANASNRAISCAEILKREFHSKANRDLFQMTRIGYKSVEELWKPMDTALDALKVIRKIPHIYILLSKDPLDLNEPGVQHKASALCRQSTDSLNRNTNKTKNRNKSKPKNSPKNRPKHDGQSTQTIEAKGSTGQS